MLLVFSAYDILLIYLMQKYHSKKSDKEIIYFIVREFHSDDFILMGNRSLKDRFQQKCSAKIFTDTKQPLLSYQKCSSFGY